MHAYVIKRGGRWCTGHSYATGVGPTFSWTAEPFEARIYKNAPTLVPKGGRVVRIPVSPFIYASLHLATNGERVIGCVCSEIDPSDRPCLVCECNPPAGSDAKGGNRG